MAEHVSHTFYVSTADREPDRRPVSIASPTIDYPDGYSLSFRDADSADVYIGARLSGATHSDAIAAALTDGGYALA